MNKEQIYEKYPEIEWLKSITSTIIIGNDGKDFRYVAVPNEPFDDTFTVMTIEEYNANPNSTEISGT